MFCLISSQSFKRYKGKTWPLDKLRSLFTINNDDSSLDNVHENSNTEKNDISADDVDNDDGVDNDDEDTSDVDNSSNKNDPTISIEI